MAADCTSATLVNESRCLAAGLFDHQLLAYIAYQLAVNAGQEPTTANLAALGKCLAAGLGDRQLMAAIALFACESVPA